MTLSACGQDSESPTSPRAEPTPLAASSASSLVFRQVSSGGSHNCGVTTDNRVYCWGLNYNGELGTGTAGGPEVLTPVAVASPYQFRSVSAGAGYTCAVTVFDALFCWGENGNGQLGNGTTLMSALPVRVATRVRIREVSTGSHHTCAVSVGDIAYCWGRNDHGQVGDGTTAQRSVPTRPLGWAHFSTISTGDEFTCGVTTTNAVTPPRRAYCWGADHGWLGSPSSGANFQLTPRLVSGGRAFRSVDAGTYRSCGVTVGNLAFCWGLGVVDGTPVTSPLPMRVGDLRFRQLEAGGSFACGVTTAGKIYC
jgi:alpha-tubulin suppressor-like RCC1 family protein